MAERNELKILYPEVELYGYKLKPWGLKQLSELSPYLYMLKDDVKKKGVDIFKLFGLDTSKAKKDKDVDSIMVEGLFDLGTSIFPYAIKIITISSGMKQEEAEKLGIDQSLIFLLTIVEQNINFLKNCFGLVTQKIEELRVVTGDHS